MRSRHLGSSTSRCAARRAGTLCSNAIAPPSAAYPAPTSSLLHVAVFHLRQNHGLSQELSDEVFRVVKAFFALPLEEKLKIENIHRSQQYNINRMLKLVRCSPQFRGYSRVGSERTNNKARPAPR